jgi:hypothetical protein
VKSRAALVRMTMLSALIALVGGHAHPASPTSGYAEMHQGRAGSLPVQRRALSALNIDMRSADMSRVAVPAPRSDRESALTGEDPVREPNAAFELDLWTTLAGSLGLMLFVAMRRL